MELGAVDLDAVQVHRQLAVQDHARLLASEPASIRDLCQSSPTLDELDVERLRNLMPGSTTVGQRGVSCGLAPSPAEKAAMKRPVANSGNAPGVGIGGGAE